MARGEREWVPLLREFYDPSEGPRGREAPRAAAPRPHHRGDRRGLQRRPSHGHPPGTQRTLPGLLAVSRAQGDPARCPARSPNCRPSKGVGQACPSCEEGTLVAKRGRFGVFAGCSRYPDCDYIHRTGPPPPPPLPFEVAVPHLRRGDPHDAPRASHGQRLLRLLALSTLRLHDQPRAARCRSTTRTPAPWRSRTRAASACAAGPAWTCPLTVPTCPGGRFPAGHPTRPPWYRRASVAPPPAAAPGAHGPRAEQ